MELYMGYNYMELCKLYANYMELFKAIVFCVWVCVCLCVGVSGYLQLFTDSATE